MKLYLVKFLAVLFVVGFLGGFSVHLLGPIGLIFSVPIGIAGGLFLSTLS